ncbi:hypothetical protein C8Q80DRAFT_67951 [Daedaleopsis nitida]|nr:hypothetical protein C8Q80DRAFT_67951 [Daedaleopsis nitida]
MHSTTRINPTAGQAVGVMAGVQLQNDALRLERQGDFTGAEQKYLQAIRVKESGLGTNDITTALSYNSLGELYLTMTRLDKAEEYLNKALRVRERAGPPSDLAVTRDNMAKLYEMKGDLGAAEKMRLQGAPDNIACSNFNCSNISIRLSDLSKCATCKSILYCSRPCQVADWKRHKKYCQKRTPDA